MKVRKSWREKGKQYIGLLSNNKNLRYLPNAISVIEKDEAKHCGRAANTPTSYSGDSELKSRAGDRLY
jgi:hypothetical protein